MAKINFYRQKRADGGVRTGLSVDDDIVFDRFEGQRARHDPALRWFVDVRCEGKLPADPESAREWLLEHASVIKAGLEEFAELLKAGLDVEGWPAMYRLRRAPKGTKVTLVCSAAHMFDARHIAAVLGGVARSFEEYVKRLRAAEPVGR